MSAVDWSLVKFPVACGRCGEDLFGREDATCPACDLKLEWEELVPLERLKCLVCEYSLYGLRSENCPECGTSIDWAAALEVYRCKALGYYEFSRRKDPFRSFFATAFGVFHPNGLWERISLLHTPRLGLILAWFIPALMVVFLFFWIAIAAAHASLNFYPSYNKMIGPNANVVPGSGVREIFLWFQEFISGIITPQLAVTAMFFVAVYICLSLCFLWPLFLFTQSLKLCRVKPSHMVRVWFYSMAVPTWTLFLGSFVLARIIMVLAVLGGLALILLLQWVALKRYIKMPHAFWVALSVTVIGLLSTPVVVGIMQSLMW